jgi:hypothetical protein
VSDPSDLAARTWAGDWGGRVVAHFRALGYSSVAEFLERNPAEPYLALADRLGDDMAAFQLERVQFEDAQRSGTVRRAAMDSLARDVNDQLPGGWPDDSTGHFGVARVYATWATRLEMTDAGLKALADAVWAALSPPAGWLPTREDDPLITAAFDRGWPP